MAGSCQQERILKGSGMHGLILVISLSSRYALCKSKTAVIYANSARQTPHQPPASPVTYQASNAVIASLTFYQSSVPHPYPVPRQFIMHKSESIYKTCFRPREKSCPLCLLPHKKHPEGLRMPVIILILVSHQHFLWLPWSKGRIHERR